MDGDVELFPERIPADYLTVESRNIKSGQLHSGVLEAGMLEAGTVVVEASSPSMMAKISFPDGGHYVIVYSYMYIHLWF